MSTNIQLSFAPDTNLDMMVTYEMAARIWERYLSDDVTVHIYMGSTDQLPTNVAGGALSGFSAHENYTTFRNSLTDDATSFYDSIVVDNLDTNTYHKVRLENQEEEFDIENDELKLTRANAKSIGMVGGAETMLDGVILMNDLSAHSTISWDYDPVDTSVSDSQVDALSVALHEIGHILGFVSGIDNPELLSATEILQNSKYDDDSNYYQDLVNNLHQITPLDLFRRSYDTTGSKTTDLTIGNDPFFAIGNGYMNLGYFSEGLATSLGGDGYQASHWKNSNDNPRGIMDPTIATGETMEISWRDILAFDVMGWNTEEASINLSSIESEAKTHLASELNLTVAEMEADPIASANSLASDRSYDIAEMVYESEVYESLWGGSTSTWSSIEDVYYSLWGGSTSTWQEFLSNISNLMWQTSAFSTFEEKAPEPIYNSPMPDFDPLIGTLKGTVSFNAGEIDELLKGGQLGSEQQESELGIELNLDGFGDPFALAGGDNSSNLLLPGVAEDGSELALGGVETLI